MNSPLSTLSSRRGAFTLTEVLLVVSILGILTAIAVPAMNQYQVEMQATKARRNAQTVANIYTGAQVTGLEFYDGTNDLTHIVKKVVAGGVVTEGPLAGQVFGVKGLSDAEVADALPHLQFMISQK